MELSYYEKCLKRIEEANDDACGSGFVNNLYYSTLSDASYRIYFSDDPADAPVVVPLAKEEARFIATQIDAKINKVKDKKQKETLSRL